MKKTIQLKVLRTFFWCVLISLFIVSCKSKDDDPDPIEEMEEMETIPPVVFTTIGDVPYNDNQRANLQGIVSAHNAKSNSEFVIHVGDIKQGVTACDEIIYEDVSNILKEFDAPTFIILGDNEYNDCEYPDQALQFWNSYFFNFNKSWAFDPTVSYQEAQPENFAWTQDKVLFIGINLVGSAVHDEQEWSARLQNDAKWVQDLLLEHNDDTEAAVIFGHANIVNFGPVKFEPFTDTFRNSAATYDKPVLYLHGDGHTWIEDRPWPEQNILRLQINGGSEAIQVTVDTSKENTFSFDTAFLD